MKPLMLLFAGLLLLSVVGCSEDEPNGSASFFGVSVTTKDNKIVEPKWLADIVNAKESGVYRVSAVSLVGKGFYSFGNHFSSNSCIAFQFWTEDGEQVECDSKLYKELQKASEKEQNVKELWGRLVQNE